MKSIAVLAVAALAATAACTQRTEEPAAAAPVETRTIVETREVPAAPVVVEREVPVAVAPPIVIDRDDRDRDTTTVRAGQGGIEVETRRN